MKYIKYIFLVLWFSVVGTGAIKASEYEVSRLDTNLKKQMLGKTWKRGCPVPFRDLRQVRVPYVDFDGSVHYDGLLIVHKDVAKEVGEIFVELYEKKFPINSIKPMWIFDGNDDKSMARDNTSAFNCRKMTGSTKKWSKHSYGKAIDINPLENPYVKRGIVLPASGRSYYILRKDGEIGVGMIKYDSDVVKLFHSYGWQWGGNWRSLKDYQHFEKKYNINPQKRVSVKNLFSKVKTKSNK